MGLNGPVFFAVQDEFPFDGVAGLLGLVGALQQDRRHARADALLQPTAHGAVEAPGHGEVLERLAWDSCSNWYYYSVFLVCHSLLRRSY